MGHERALHGRPRRADYPSGMTRLLAVAGSLRAGSSNAALLAAAGLLLPPGVTLMHFAALAAVPAFSPDWDVEPPPDGVAVWRRALREADAVLVSSPEYAHGMPGVLKNALDWVVGSGELYAKPIALLNPSPESEFAHPQLAEVLRTMGCRLVEDASITIRVPRRGATPESIVADAEAASLLSTAVAALLAAVRPSTGSGI